MIMMKQSENLSSSSTRAKARSHINTGHQARVLACLSYDEQPMTLESRSSYTFNLNDNICQV